MVHAKRLDNGCTIEHNPTTFNSVFKPDRKIIMKITCNQIKAALERIGSECTARSYSGRGMYGRSCVGIVTDDAMEVLVDLTLAICEFAEDEGVGHADSSSGMFGRISTDNMGRSEIVYFPEIEWTGKEEEEEMDLDA